MTLPIRLILVLALAGASVMAGYLYGRRGTEFAERRKLGLIAATTSQAGKGQLLVVGDSIVDMQSLPRMCGLTALNAGIGGAKAGDMLDLAAQAVQIAAPSRVVFAIGVNDVVNDRGFSLDRWSDTMRKLVATFPGKPILVGVTRLPGAHAADIDRMNDRMKTLAMARGGVFVSGLATAETYDGIHPSLAGATAWQARVAAACETLSRP